MQYVQGTFQRTGGVIFKSAQEWSVTDPGGHVLSPRLELGPESRYKQQEGKCRISLPRGAEDSELPQRRTPDCQMHRHCLSTRCEREGKGR